MFKNKETHMVKKIKMIKKQAQVGDLIAALCVRF